jgi:hypothetical protein
VISTELPALAAAPPREGVGAAWLAGRAATGLSWFYCLPILATALLGLAARLELTGYSAALRWLDLLVGLVLIGSAIGIFRHELHALASHGDVLGARVDTMMREAERARQHELEVARTAAEEAAREEAERRKAGIQIGEIAVDGPIPARDAEAGVARAVDRLEACYQAVDGELAGRAHVRFVVNGAGGVAHVELIESDLPEAVKPCIFIAFYRTGFASHSGSRATISVPVQFSPLAPE